MSTQRLGLTVIPGAGWRASDVRNVAREAEAAGFDAIFTTEVNNDALATAQLMGSATTHIADGIMPTMWSPERVTQSAARAGQGRAQAPHLPALDITLGLPTFIGDNLDSLRDAARQNLGLYTFFPYFQRMWRESGFGTEADQMKNGAGPAALSDRLLDSFCLLGPVTSCQERLAAYRAAGVTLPILNPPIGPDAALAVIRAFAT